MPALRLFHFHLGIDESASKECGAISLDILLRAGVLVEGDGGNWELAYNYNTSRIYIVDDAKTVKHD